MKKRIVLWAWIALIVLTFIVIAVGFIRDAGRDMADPNDRKLIIPVYHFGKRE